MDNERGRSSISQASSYQEMGEYWDTHDAGEIWEQTQPAEFEVDIRSEKVFSSPSVEPSGSKLHSPG